VTKQERLLDIVEEARDNVEMGRVIVFTQFRATQQQILDRLVSEGYTVHAFHGGHSSSEKRADCRGLRRGGRNPRLNRRYE